MICSRGWVVLRKRVVGGGESQRPMAQMTTEQQHISGTWKGIP